MLKIPSNAYNSLDWIGTSPEVRPALNDNWRARRELASALRRLNNAVLSAEVATEMLESVTTAVLAQAERIEACERVFGHKAHSERIAAQQGRFPDLTYETSPAIGQSNAVAPPMHMWHADGRVHGLVTPGWGHEGPFEHLHGGVIALLFDQLLGIGQRVTGSGGFTGSLTTRYHHPTPLNKPLHLIANIDRVEGRKKFMVGELWVDELITASCEGVFIAARNQTDTAAP